MLVLRTDGGEVVMMDPLNTRSEELRVYLDAQQVFHEFRPQGLQSSEPVSSKAESVDSAGGS